jgi:hypothetical protein
MTHPMVTLRKGFPYTYTEAPFDRSLASIEALLQKFGCTRIAKSQDLRGNVPLITLLFEKEGVAYVIPFPVTYYPKEKLNMAISGRIVYYKVKALLVDVEIGMLSFLQAMSPYLAIEGAPLYEYVEEKKDLLAMHRSPFPEITAGGRP